MPKVNLGQKKPDPLVEKILGRMRYLNMSLEEVAYPIMCGNTLSRRFYSPGNLTRDELHHLSRKLNIPIDELRALI